MISGCEFLKIVLLEYANYLGYLQYIIILVTWHTCKLNSLNAIVMSNE